MDDFGVSVETSGLLFRAQQDLRGALRDSLRVGVVLGHALRKAKSECRHGDFGSYLKRHFEGTDRHARNYMALAAEYPDPDSVPSMSLREALRLIAGKNEKAKPLAHEALGSDTAAHVLRMLTTMNSEIRQHVLAAFAFDGLTKDHQAVKLGKRIEAAISKLRAYVMDGLSAAEHEADGTEALHAAYAEILDVAWPCTAEELDAAYRQAVKQAHPDAGGTNEQFVRVQRAYELLKSAMEMAAAAAAA